MLSWLAKRSPGVILGSVCQTALKQSLAVQELVRLEAGRRKRLKHRFCHSYKDNLGMQKSGSANRLTNSNTSVHWIASVVANWSTVRSPTCTRILQVRDWEIPERKGGQACCPFWQRFPIQRQRRCSRTGLRRADLSLGGSRPGWSLT